MDTATVVSWSCSSMSHFTKADLIDLHKCRSTLVLFKTEKTQQKPELSVSGGPTVSDKCLEAVQVPVTPEELIPVVFIRTLMSDKT